MKNPLQHGFTLLEMLVAVAIIMMLAGIAVVAFDETAEDALTAATEQQLQRVRTAIDYYMFQHEEVIPGFDNGTGTWSSDALTQQLTQATDDAGNWAAPATPGFPYGPYLLDGMPSNPFNDMQTIAIVAPGNVGPYPDNSTGWVFFAETGNFRANSTGNTSKGDPIYDL